MRPRSDQRVDAGTQDRCVVVGATGKTGRAVAEALARARGPGTGRRAPGPGVRRPRGTTPVAVDLVTGQGLAPALDGARAAYHLAPNMHPDEVGIAHRVAAPRRPPGCRDWSSTRCCTRTTPGCRTTCARPRRRRVLREALGERLTVLRPAAYHQNLLGQARSGMLAVPYSLDAPFTTSTSTTSPRWPRTPSSAPTPGDPRPGRPGGAHRPADDRGGRGRPGPPGERHRGCRCEWRPAPAPT